MKQIICILILTVSIPLYGQESENIKKTQLEVGFVYHMNNLNEDNYLNNKSPAGLSSDRKMTGLELRFIMPTKSDHLDLAFGMIIEKNWDDYLGTTDYKLNGGGVYAGISPKIGSKNLGITSLLAIGIFSYKEYFAYYSDYAFPIIDIYEKKSSFGLGAMSSIGIYARIGPIGIHPQVQAIFSGGNDASFLFYGIVIPLTIEF